MKKHIYPALLITFALAALLIIFMLLSGADTKGKYFTDTGTLYLGEVGCDSMKNFGPIESHGKLNLLFPDVKFSQGNSGVLKFRSRISFKDKDRVEKIITSEVLPHLNKRYDFFQSIENCVVFPTRPYLVNFKRLEVSGEKYKILSYALVIFFILLFIVFLSSEQLKKLFKNRTTK